MQLVQKLAKVNFYIRIVTNDKWSQFPEMLIYFELEYPQFVKFEYQTSVRADQTGYTITRLIVDGQEDDLFRTIEASNYYYRTNQNRGKMWLEKGKHWARVDYRSSSTPLPYILLHKDGSDFQVNYFRVSYYQVGR